MSQAGRTTAVRRCPAAMTARPAPSQMSALLPRCTAPPTGYGETCCLHRPALICNERHPRGGIQPCWPAPQSDERPPQQHNGTCAVDAEIKPAIVQTSSPAMPQMPVADFGAVIPPVSEDAYPKGAVFVEHHQLLTACRRQLGGHDLCADCVFALRQPPHLRCALAAMIAVAHRVQAWSICTRAIATTS